MATFVDPLAFKVLGTGEPLLTANLFIEDRTDAYSSLTIYAADAAAIRNNIYQLARKTKIIGDALRAYGLLT